jgi:hypothetical protein
MESKRFSINKDDLKKIAVGALVALGGALLTYVTETLVQVDFGQWTPLVVSMSSVLINTARKFLAEVR